MCSTADSNVNEEMQATRARSQALVENLADVVARITAVASPSRRDVRLVAISKLKPASDLLALYNNTGQRHFGENYFQELLDKSKVLPLDIEWHFTGALQTNKCRQLAEKIPNLWAVESVDAVRKADALEKGRAALKERVPETENVRIFVQVNTSGEDSKSGVPPSDALPLATHILKNCPHLTLTGLMTIGAIARSRESSIPNEDFLLLKQTRGEVAEGLGIEKEQLELSMGMSEDFEAAIGIGATNVRVGTTIFGERPKKGEVADA
ncbi:hypothetical protein RUND412_000325 [Rhizina undulata]